MTKDPEKISVIAVIFLIAIDQIAKYIIRTQGGFYICNKGVAFGIPAIYALLLLIFVFVFILALNSKFKIWNFKFQILNCSVFRTTFAILILLGGISNLIDRIYFGCVIDFIDLGFWPVFNIADIYITIGAIVLIFSYVFKSPFGGNYRPKK